MTLSPPLLKSGDTVAIIAPSRMIEASQLKEAYEVLSSWGLHITNGKSLFIRNGYFAGPDQERLADLQQALDDDRIRAVFCARGGYGVTRIVDQINFKAFIENPKWIIGFSDITALHLKVTQLGIQSIHGLMPVQFGYPDVASSISSLKHLLFEGNGKIEVQSFPENRIGQAMGELVGGNLSLVVDSLGTPSEIDTKGRILFLEEIDEYLYKIDRMFVQLKRAGKLSELKGLVIGDFTDCKDTKIPFGMELRELVAAHCREFTFPIAFGFPVGHEAQNMAIPVSKKAELVVKENLSELIFNELSK